MGDTGTGERARRAGRTVYSASQNAARAGAAAAGGASRAVHRMTGASGAGRTGLSNLIELTAAGSVGDAFVAVALAGSLFFSASVDQARGRAAFALLITIAPYAILAPFIGPLLDRVRQGNRYIMMGTLLARGLLCWGMASAVEHNDAVTLLPAAFGVLVLQKAYGVTRAAVTPRLLPAEITLVTANARANLASLIATSVGVVLALGVDKVAGGHGGGAAWVLRVGTVIYLAAMALALRLPDRVDVTQDADGVTDGSAPTPASMPNASAGPAGPRHRAGRGKADLGRADRAGSERAGSERSGTERVRPGGRRWIRIPGHDAAAAGGRAEAREVRDSGCRSRRRRGDAS